MPLLDAVLVALGVAGIAVAIAAVAPLKGVVALAGRDSLKRAWWVLIGIILVCAALQAISLVEKIGRPAEPGDLAAAGIHLLGPCFVLAIALLSRSTARDLVRMASLAEAASYDPLTGLPNRRFFDERLQLAVETAAASQQPLTLLLLDIDHFKRVNDTFGHDAGDAALCQVALRILAGLRRTDTAARIGGEEFAVILPGLAPGEAAQRGERLRREVASASILLDDHRRTQITVSLGLATAGAGESPTALFRRADQALYAAKHGGRDRLSLAAA